MTTQGTQEDAWTWPCPYCGTSNALEASVCLGCQAQLRDPEEDDLFTTVATDNAQMVDPSGPRVRESLWSTEAPPEELIAEEVDEIVVDPTDQQWQPSTSETPPTATAEPGTTGPPAAPEGPFSRSATQGDAHGAPGPASFAPDQGVAQGAPFASAPNAFAQQRPAPAAHQGHSGAAFAPGGEPAQASAASFQQVQDQQGGSAPRQHDAPTVTPDENGLSVAVDRLGASEREACAVPIGVCGALLGDQEVVLGLLAGHLLGHAAVMMLTNTRILVSNARRWKPLLDQFLPTTDLAVHVRHDRAVASVTIVQGDRLSTVDDISDVPAAIDLAERIRAMSERGA